MTDERRTALAAAATKRGRFAGSRAVAMAPAPSVPAGVLGRIARIDVTFERHSFGNEQTGVSVLRTATDQRWQKHTESSASPFPRDFGPWLIAKS